MHLRNKNKQSDPAVRICLHYMYTGGADQGGSVPHNGLEKLPFLFKAQFLSLMVTRFLSAIPCLFFFMFYSSFSLADGTKLFFFFSP